MGDLSSRRGQILGTEPDGRLVRVKALVPEAELDRYATTLHSITHGRGTYRAKFHVYQEVPPDAAQKVAEVRSEEHTSELQSQSNLVCRLLLEKKKQYHTAN